MASKLRATRSTGALNQAKVEKYVIFGYYIHIPLEIFVYSIRE